VIPYIAATYFRKTLKGDHKLETKWEPFIGRIFPWKRIMIVDWNGQPLNPDKKKQAERALSLLPHPSDVHVRRKLEKIRFMDEYIREHRLPW